MKKTVTANIAGTVFNIEEDAYEQLQRYLAGIRANFSGSAGAAEIMSDIEARIAELFSERLVGRNVVTLADVEHVQGVMGQPEDFAGEPDTSSPESTAYAPTGGKSKRRFLRDPDDKWVGGVISGISAFVGIEPIWFRVGFIVAMCLGWGTPIIVYLLLWVLVPKASTAAEKLQMRGEPVTVENIKRVVEEGGDHLKQGAERVANEAKDLGKDWGPRAQQWGQEAGSAARRAGSDAGTVIAKLFGGAIIIAAFGLLLALITGLIGGSVSLWHATWTNEDLGLLDLGSLIFTSKAYALWFVIGVFVLLVVPIIALFLAGFRLLLNTRTPKWLGWTLSLLWFAALVPTVIAGIDLASDFHRRNSVRTEETLVQPKGDVLYLDALDPAEDSESWSVHFDAGDEDVDLDGLHVENGNIYGAWAQLDVERSADTLFHLEVVREAHGSTAKAALARAEEIQFRVEQNGDVLLVSPVLSYSATDKFRAQDVHFTLEVPLGKSVFFRAGSRSVIYDIDNVTNTLDRDMIGRTWTMTTRGLEDPKAPRARKEREEEDKEATPADTTKHGPVAATVLPSPRRTKAVRAARPAPAAAVTRTTVDDVQLPSLFRLFSGIITL